MRKFYQHVSVSLREGIRVLALNINCTDYAPIFGCKDGNDDFRARTAKSRQIARASLVTSLTMTANLSLIATEVNPCVTGKVG